MEVPKNVDPDTFLNLLNSFNHKNSSVKPLAEIEFDPKLKVQLWNKLIDVLEDSEFKSCHGKALLSLKILSREKRGLEDLINERTIKVLLRFVMELSQSDRNDDDALSESLKCWSNLLLQSPKVQSLCEDRNVVMSLIDLTSNYEQQNRIPDEVMTFLLRVLFLITALRPNTRSILLIECRGLTKLASLFEILMRKDPNDIIIRDSLVSIFAELSKCIFNVTMAAENYEEEEDLEQFRKICSLIRLVFLSRTTSIEKKEILISNCINVLSNVPTDAMNSFLTRDIFQSEVEYNGHSMVVPKGILDYLLSHIEESSEVITPPLLVLCKLSRHDRNVRKYMRKEVLPPLRDIQRRPEEGTSPRNKFCKMLTSPNINVSTMVAEFLFVLCKEQVSRMVKHTGYGNAAGLLARRGLMCGGKGANSDAFSDDDEDSDTEEYSQNAHRINSIVGCVDEEGLCSKPFEGMSEEQKEYEAIKLVGLIDKLNNAGIIRPSIPGPDGKLVPIEHVSQLTEHIQKEDDDDDD